MLSNLRSAAFSLFALAAFSCAMAAQSTAREAAYGTDPAQKLDLSVPAGKGFATVVFVHGGSLNSGDKSDADYGHVCDPFALAGFACANVNYRLAPDHPWPAQPEDVAAALAWVREHIAERGGDPHRLFLLGHSSGAMLVAVIATDERYLAKHGMKSSDLRGVLPMGSIMWDVEQDEALAKYGRERVEQAFARDPDSQTFGNLAAYEEHWPIRHVHAGLPPFLFLIAETERENPPVLKTDSEFVERARKLGNDAALKVLAGRTHYGAIRQLHQPGDPVFAVIIEFLRKQIGAGE